MTWLSCFIFSPISDNAEIWEEWETNEEVNPPPSILQSAAPTAPLRTASSSSNGSGGNLGSSSGNLGALAKNSHSREDVPALSGNYRSAGTGSAPSTTTAAAGGVSPTASVGTLGTLGSSTGGSLGRLKAGNNSGSGGNLAGSAGARANKSKLVNTPPPADVDLFAVSTGIEGS